LPQNFSMKTKEQNRNKSGGFQRFFRHITAGIHGHRGRTGGFTSPL
jgi:hypothetical protein